MKAPILLSVVVPYDNHDSSIRQVVAAIGEAVAPLVSDYEIVLVDNGSSDERFAEYRTMLGPDGFPNVQVYRLIRAVEHDVAAWAGVENSLGDYVLVYDPRSENLSRLPDALREVEHGRELVFLRNVTPTDHGALEAALGTGFRWLFRRLTGIDLRLDATPGRLMSKRIVSYLQQQPRPGARYRTLPSASGFAKATLTYAMPRGGEARRGLAGRASSAVRLLVSNSIAPLRAVSALAFLGALLNLAYSAYVVVIALFKPDVAPGWTTLSLQQSVMFFLLMAVMAVLTEYLIHMIRWTSDGPGHFLVGEATSAVLTRRTRLNVERALPGGQQPSPPGGQQPSLPGGQQAPSGGPPATLAAAEPAPMRPEAAHAPRQPAAAEPSLSAGGGA